METQTIQTAIQPDYPVLDAIATRRSPRAFRDRSVSAADLRSVLEAARWAASANNEQPWLFIVATKDDPAAFEKLHACTNDGNRPWAGAAPVLILALARTHFAASGKPNAYHLHDVGQAMAHLGIQAAALGLVLHQMAGILKDRIRETYQLPDDVVPVTISALGYQGLPDDLPEGVSERQRQFEGQRQPRKPLGESVYAGEWGTPLPELPR
jgi:nitroreductase